MKKKLWAEFIGTYCLLFAGTGAIIINDLSGGAVTHIGIALTFGLIVFAMIAALRDVSGAHLNPAVTVGLFLAGRFPGHAVIPYTVSQLIGAVTASTTLLALFPQHPTLGGTIPAGSVLQSLLVEILLTAILMFVILSVTAGDKSKQITAGMAIGSTIALAALFAGPVSGASMNPARSLAPALIAWQLNALWIYLAGPVLGATLAVLVCRCSREAGCCPIPAKETK
jgi:aquaporin Z